MKMHIALVAALFGFAAPTLAHAEPCGIDQATIRQIQNQLLPVTQNADHNGGILAPNRMWLAIVDRQGVLCSIINTNATNGDAWPASRANAIAKAFTGNGFANSALALSSANLYAATLPGGSLWGLQETNTFNAFVDAQNIGPGWTSGGIVALGGGLGLYRAGQAIGGLGVSGDTACADHAIAYRVRHLAGLDGIPGGVGLSGTDNIVYAAPNTTPTAFQHPHCFPTDITP